MPRPPAPLTVTRPFYYWDVQDSDGLRIASFQEEADARAFVALPALEQALLSIANSSCCGCCQEAALVAKAALAQADGTSPKE